MGDRYVSGSLVRKAPRAAPSTLERLRRIEGALEVAEQRYHDLVEHAPIGIIRTTLEGRFLSVNAAFTRQLGYDSTKEVLGLDIPREVYWDEEEHERLILRNEQLGGISASEVRLTQKDGRPIWVQMDSRAVKDETGKTLHFESFVRSIDDRKRAERRFMAFSDLGRRLSSVETTLEAARIIRGCADEIWRGDACSLNLYSAELDRVEPLLAADVIEGRRMEQPPAGAGTPPSPRERRVLNEGALLIARGDSAAASGGMASGDTQRFSGSIMIAPIRKGWAVIGFVSVESNAAGAYDASDLEALQGLADFCGGALARIRATESLRQSERRLREAEHVGQVGSFEWYLHDLSIAASDEMFRIFEIDPRRFQGKVEGFLGLVHPEDRPRVWEETQRAVAELRPFEYEYRIHPREGETRMIYARGEVIADARGQPARVIGVCQDVTERKRAEDEIHASREGLLVLSRRLIEAQEAERRRIARELHDEIGQALTAVKINLQAARRPDDDAEHASRLAESMEIVETTMRQVRDLSLALRPSLLDDLGLVAALRWYVDSQTQRAGLDARFEAEPGTIRLSPDLEIGCYRVVQEAVNNVVRHAGARHMLATIRLQDGKLRLLIRDDGCGFNVKAARARAHAGESMGLLSMSERARLLGGRLTIESVPGEGTEVRAVFSAGPAP